MLNIKRRGLVRGFFKYSVAHLAGYAAGGILPSAAAASDPGATEADRWFRTLMDEKTVYKDFGSPLDLRRFKDPFYIVLGPLLWKPGAKLIDASPVTVPRGFVTDMASVPRIFWSIFRPDGDYAYAAILHDYLYWVQDRSREEADAVFRYAMEDLKIDDFQASSLYRAVSEFGKQAWEKNQALKSAGERRVLALLPDRSDVTWNEWKRRSDAF